MSLSDSAEYWWPIFHEDGPKKHTKIAHDCKPRGGVPGTYKRNFCPICGNRFSSNYFKETAE